MAGRKAQHLQVLGLPHSWSRNMARKPDTPCTICGELTWTGRASQPADLRVCRPCRRARINAHLVTSCVACNRPFAAPQERKTCSDTCRYAARDAGHNGTGQCLDCKVDFTSRGPRKRCEPCAARRKAEQYAEKCRRRRVLKRGGAVEPYTLVEITQRDGHRCQLCRRKVNMAIQHPDPKSPSIDHVIPVTEGGDDVRANVQLAHLGCNSSKGARGSQQLALVG